MIILLSIVNSGVRICCCA